MKYPNKVYLNGEIISSDKAKISAFDRGFLFGDGVYEVLIQLKGKLFSAQEHIDRLQSSLEKIKLVYDTSCLIDDINNLIQQVELTNKDALVYIQITRGAAPRSHAFPKETTPTIFMYAIPKDFPKINTTPYSVVTTNDFRWEKGDIKMTSLLGNVLANQFAAENDCYETLLIRNGIFTEASHCNVFFVKDKCVYTHPANSHILNGITRQIVIDVCLQLGIDFKEEGYPFDELQSIDEAFLTGTTTQVGSIRKINDIELFKNDEIGPITQRIQQAFSELH